MRVLQAATALIVGLGLSACETTGSTTSVVLGEAATRLAPYEKDDLKAARNPDPAHEIELAELCDPSKAAPHSLVGVAALFVGPVIDLILDQISDAAAERLKEYSAAYSGVLTMPRYRVDGRGEIEGGFYDKSGSPLKTSIRCFTFERRDPKNKDMIYSQLIGLMVVNPTEDGLLLRPLRLVMNTPKARHTGKLGTSIKITGDALWRTGANGESKTGRVFDTTLVSQAFKSADFGKPAYWLTDPNGKDTATVMVPLVPRSQGAKPGEFGLGNVKLTVTMAEAGDAPWILKTLAKAFDDNKDDIGDLLKGAAKKALGIEE